MGTTNFRGTFSDNQPRWSTFPGLAAPTARARPAKSTPNTRSRNTRPERPPYSRKESVDTTASNPVMVVKRSPFSTRRQDNQEGRVEIGMHSLQDKGTISVEAMQTLRVGW